MKHEIRHPRTTCFSFSHCLKISRCSLLVLFCQLILLSFFVATGLAAESSVAKVSQLSGTITIERQGTTVPVAEGTLLQVNDRLVTGADGAVGIIFNDETTLALGPQTDITIQDYLFEPEASRLSFIVKILQGTASYVSGLIAKLSPESAKFITPSATIGVRGTKFVIQVDDV